MRRYEWTQILSVLYYLSNSTPNCTQLLILVWRRRVFALASTRTMEVSFALTGKGYVLVASDQNAGRSIVKMKADEDKIKVLGSHLIMAHSGEAGG